ncbi:hypothetical protein LCGC14_0509160 [marine sediment metagenome]|uniref:Uncharacterized protein n=1 Tax=marine sediment metagenome TaxID=412755 RepID=A0A0F9S1N5_9ZZZZ|nr:hypothetical protein [bacterium]
METICLGKNRKLTMSARGNVISYCECRVCKGQNQSEDKTEEGALRQSEVDSSGCNKTNSK